MFRTPRIVYIIDGRLRVRSHGDLEMPVWGVTFSRPLAGADDASIRARIDALVKYLESVQKRRASNRDPNAMLAQ
jgi:hypothetical protein